MERIMKAQALRDNNNMGFIDVFKASNILLTLLNVLFFVVVQYFFFKEVASLQFNNVLASKVDILNAGAGHCWDEAVEHLCKHGPGLVEELLINTLNIPFNKLRDAKNIPNDQKLIGRPNSKNLSRKNNVTLLGSVSVTSSK